MNLDKQAHRLATKEYLKQGYFGGKANIVRGVVTGKKYFDFQGIEQQILERLKK